MNFCDFDVNASYKLRSLDNKTYVFGEGQCFELNKVAKLVFLAIGRDMELEEFVNKVSLKFEQKNQNQIEKDIQAFVTLLEEANVITKSK